MATPSLAMIPAAYKAAKLYSQLPVDGVGDFTVSRNDANGSRVNQDGLIEFVSTNVPRLDYLNGTCPELLLEPSSENLITYSEDLTNAAWSKTGVTASTAQGIAPDGANTMNRITEDTSSGTHRVREDFSSATGERTASFYFDSANRSYLAFSFLYSVNSRGVGLIIDLSDNSEFDSLVSGTVNYSYKVTDLPNSTIKRVEITAENTVENIMNSLQISSFDGGSYSFDPVSRTPDYTGDGSNSLLCWGFQAETLGYATSYIATSGATVTRLDDSFTGAGDVNTFNSTEGVFFVELKPIDIDGAGFGVAISDGTSNNRVVIAKDTSTTSIRGIVTVGGSNEYDFTGSAYVDDFIKIAIKYKANDFATWVNGVEVDTSSIGSTLPVNTLNELRFTTGGVPAKFFGRVKQILTFNTALSDSELQALTT